MTILSLLLFPMALFAGLPAHFPASWEVRAMQNGHTVMLPSDTAGTRQPVGEQRARQVRIEHRVIIRIVPVGRTPRARQLAAVPAAQPIRVVERPIDGCVPIRNIVGVAPEAGNRLRLYTRDRRLLTLRFASTCPSEAFYSGFYLEQNGDGLLCPRRDMVHSRAGVRCPVSQVGQLVAQR